MKNPEQIWVADITWLSIKNDYCYLYLITDAYSKKIMGYQVSDNLAAAITIKALERALRNRKYTTPLIHHSDRGLQYCSAGYTKLRADNNMSISMPQGGSPYDNAIAERVNGILKDEFGLDDTFQNMEHAKNEAKQSIDLYNTLRPHLSNSMLTPTEIRQQNKLNPNAWHLRFNIN